MLCCGCRCLCAALLLPPVVSRPAATPCPGTPPHRMIWLSVSEMSRRERLLRAMLSAMKAPMYTMPRHCFSRVRRWFSHDSRMATGASTQKLNSMWPAGYVPSGVRGQQSNG